MKIQYIRLLISLFLVLAIQPKWIIAQNQAGKDYVAIKSVILDYNEQPIVGVHVFGKEGDIVTVTDELGNFEINVPKETMLLIEANGFKSLVIDVSDIKSTIRLEATVPLFGEKDDVHIAFGKTKKGSVTNSVGCIKASEFEGIDDPIYFNDAILGKLTGLRGTSGIRGFGNAMIVVNGMPRSYFDIPFDEIEEISILKDANASVLYGSEGANGVIMITTKRGEAHKSEINVNARTGLMVPKLYPKFLGSADYMTLYNEARINDGNPAAFDEQTISNYRNGNPFRYPDIDYYSDEYLKQFAGYNNVSADFSGGNDQATYFTNIDWYNQKSLLDFGEGKNAAENRFNIRGNIDFKINDFISSSIDAVAVFDLNNGPIGNYWSSASTLRPNLFSPLIQIDRVSQSNENLSMLVASCKNVINGQYMLGGTQEYLSNPIADVYAAGTNENVNRVFQFDNTVKFDLNQWVKGMTFQTHLNVDFISKYDQYIGNSYSVYDPEWNVDGDSIIGLTQLGLDARPGTQKVQNSSSFRRIGFFGQLNYKKDLGNGNHLDGTLLAYGNGFKWNASYQITNYANLGLRLAYDYKDKYFIDFSSALTNSAKLSKGNRTGFSPTLGLAWTVSSEDFLSQSSLINYLKLKASAGIINTDTGITGFFLYDNNFEQGSTFGWHEGVYTNSGSKSVNGLNNNLFFEQRKDINLGFESSLFNRSIWLEANVFSILNDGQIVKPSTVFPNYYSDFIPYENYNKDVYKGVEVGLSVKKEIGDFKMDLGGNLMITNSKVLQRDEVWQNSYQYREGKPVDAIYGLVDDGFFMDENDIANHASQAFGEVKPGDLKYVDQNGDNVIDDNDQVKIGRSLSPLSYALNISLTYKKLTLFALGTGYSGGNGIMQGNYYWVDGDNKYSEIVLGRWTEQTKQTATYPRLSSSANNNNFRTSTFWLYKKDYFAINRVQITFEFPETLAKKMAMSQMYIFATGNGLVRFSKNKDISDLIIGSEPDYRSFSIGLKAQF